ncbi:uncharacterized protein LOC126749033 [Anthonomus grandis grandis]|uniref:uncharacterized protein LOC126749033 n=1 Tax=Anthonomus grandis grandis TaxID=2921223 RepID=UPI002165E122|nr:uncharacterized protein LOC126749033 [Anthonomus grandis grandis]
MDGGVGRDQEDSSSTDAFSTTSEVSSVYIGDLITPEPVQDLRNKRRFYPQNQGPSHTHHSHFSSCPCTPICQGTSAGPHLKKPKVEPAEPDEGFTDQTASVPAPMQYNRVQVKSLNQLMPQAASTSGSRPSTSSTAGGSNQRTVVGGPPKLVPISYRTLDQKITIIPNASCVIQDIVFPPPPPPVPSRRRNRSNNATAESSVGSSVSTSYEDLVRKIKKNSEEIVRMKQILDEMEQQPKQNFDSFLNNVLKLMVPPSLFTIINIAAEPTYQLTDEDRKFLFHFQTDAPEAYRMLIEKYKWNLPLLKK